MNRFRDLLVSSAFLLVSLSSFAADPQWVEVRSPNFSVLTDAGEKKGRDVALHFEQMRSVFGALMTKAHVNLAVPLQIVAFRNTKEIRQFAPIFNGKPTEVAGLFQSGQDRAFIMLDMSVENPWNVVFHEYAHGLMDGNLTFRTDAWFEEGFAEYFSNIEVDNKEARVGKIPEDTYTILQQMGMMKVADLLRVQPYTKTYNETGSHRTTFYAESSLVVHYLYDNMLVPKLSVYFDTLQIQKKPVEQAVQAAFGMTPEQFDKTLRNYLASGRYRYYPIPTPVGIVPAQFTVAHVETTDATVVMADIHAHSLDYRDKALAEFQDVLKADPNHAGALRGAGFCYLQKADFANAREYLQKAAEKDLKDPRVHFYYATLLNQAGNVDETKAVLIKKELTTAIGLDPKMADAYSMLGYMQSFSGEPEKGVETLKKAVELSPRNELYQYNLANAYMANRNMEQASKIFKALAGSTTPDVAERSRQALAQLQNYEEQQRTFAVRLENQPEGGSPHELVSRGSNPGDGTVQEVQAPPIAAPVRFVKGKISAIDCSTSPEAVINVATGGKKVVLHVKDSGHVLVIGADAFSCEWKNKNVAVNYRERPDGDGDVVSVEVQ